jgi:hypothetical protein
MKSTSQNNHHISASPGKHSSPVHNTVKKVRHEDDDEDLEKEDDYEKVDKEDDYDEPSGPTGKDLKNANVFIDDDEDDFDDDTSDD